LVLFFVKWRLKNRIKYNKNGENHNTGMDQGKEGRNQSKIFRFLKNTD